MCVGAGCSHTYLSKPLLLQVEHPLFPDVLLHDSNTRSSSGPPHLVFVSSPFLSCLPWLLEICPSLTHLPGQFFLASSSTLVLLLLLPTVFYLLSLPVSLSDLLLLLPSGVAFVPFHPFVFFCCCTVFDPFAAPNFPFHAFFVWLFSSVTLSSVPRLESARAPSTPAEVHLLSVILWCQRCREALVVSSLFPVVARCCNI